MARDLSNDIEQKWALDGPKLFLMSIASIIIGILAVFAFASFGTVLGPPPDFTHKVTPEQAPMFILEMMGVLLLIPILTFALVVFHEWCHGLAFRWVGARPRYGAKFVGRLLPIVYATAPGKWLTKRQYLMVGLAPTITINVVCVLLMLPPTPLRWMLVLPLAVHLGACVGDWWIACVEISLPRGTMFEDSPEGFNFRQNRDQSH
jgi:hypothetical protein